MGALVKPAVTVPGSPQWLKATADLARSWAEAGDRDAHQMVRYLEDLRTHDWRSLVRGADDWPRFCQQVLGKDAEFVRCLEAGVAVLDGKAATVSEAVEAGRLMEHGGDRRSEDFQGNNITLKQRGTHSTYLRARLERDHPFIHRQLEAGRFPSVRQAAIAAGIVRVPTPFEQAKKLLPKLTAKERRELLKLLTDDEE